MFRQGERGEKRTLVIRVTKSAAVRYVCIVYGREGGSERSGVDNLTAGFSYVLLCYSHELRYHDTYPNLAIARTKNLLDTILQPANSSVASVMNDVVNATLEHSKVPKLRRGDTRLRSPPLAHLSTITTTTGGGVLLFPTPSPSFFPLPLPKVQAKEYTGSQVSTKIHFFFFPCLSLQ